MLNYLYLGAGMTMDSDVIDPLAILGSAALAIWLLAFIVLIGIRIIGDRVRAEGLVNLDQLATLVERLRKEAIGEPLWIAEKQAFEYQDHSAKVVAILKLVRAMHGVNSIDLLCRRGFFIDSGTLIRCINDCVSEVYFLLEEFPKDSKHRSVCQGIFWRLDRWLSIR
jgi:hypothetical protein